jgi:hypothetical protein
VSVDRAARRWSVPPWEVEAAADRDPAAMRWLLMAGDLDEWSRARAANGLEG